MARRRRVFVVPATPELLAREEKRLKETWKAVGFQELDASRSDSSGEINATVKSPPKTGVA